MNKLFLTVAMLVAFAFPAMAGHEGSGFSLVEGKPTPARTQYCITAEDAHIVGKAWVSSNRAAGIQIKLFSVPTNIGITRCGVGQGRVTPIELVEQFTRPSGEILNLIRVLAYGLNIEIILMTSIPFVEAGDPA